MKNIYVKAGWLGNHDYSWYDVEDKLGSHITGLFDALRSRGFNLYFHADGYRPEKIEAELHIEKQIPSFLGAKKFLVEVEPKFVQAQNYLPTNYIYRRIYTLRDEVSKKYLKVKYPRDVEIPIHIPFENRKSFISCIAANKNSIVRSKYSLYDERYRYIKELSERYSNIFELYGSGWGYSKQQIGLIPKVLSKSHFLKKLVSKSANNTSYKGRCNSKIEVLHNTKFTLCVENTSEKDCVTEKIYDCFTAGSIPLYLGPSNIADRVPENLFIDLRKYKEIDSLIAYLKSYTSDQYNNWFLSISEYVPLIKNEMSVENYVNTIVDDLIKELYE